MDWQDVSIAALGRVVTGRTPPSSQPALFGDEYPFVTPTDINGQERLVYTERFLSEQGRASMERLLVPAGSIAYVCIASVGKMCVIQRPSFTNQQINSVVVDESKFDPSFVYYALRHATPRIKAIAGGAATPIINKSAFSGISIQAPGLPLQRRIASLLSAYDDLIENNTRRIAILQEMARRIYEEWFVRFRFPGHENVRMVESELGLVPEGWRVEKLESVLSTLEAGTRPKGGIDPSERGVPSVGAENINGLANYDYGKEKFVSRTFFQAMRRGQVRSGDVLLYKDGAHIGRKSMFRDGYPHAQCAINEHVFILRPNAELSSAYLYFWLDQEHMTQRIRALNANAAQPGINQAGVNGLPILIPPGEVVAAFTESVEPMLALLFNLARKIPVLRRTRDLLLPKLISGELDVSEIPEPEAAAA